MDNLLTKLHTYFPDIPKLYDYQRAVLNILRKKENTLAIIPTGGGKSLIFQLTALMQPGTTLVVSPLIALMTEQVQELVIRGVSALALNSSIPAPEQRKILQNLSVRKDKIIYLSPERLQVPSFREALIKAGLTISMIVIDEAHCISQWGNSFRPDYGQIMDFVDFLHDNGQNPFNLCLTATMTERTRMDIATEFRISPSNIYVHQNVMRDNLKLDFKQVALEKEKETLLIEFLNQYQPNKTIAYLYSKQKCQRYATLFAGKYKTAYFHSGMSQDQKNKIYQEFKDGKIDILFATSAFGMGVNIPDIDAVVHLQIPNSIEEFYQQVGRGWRRKDISKICHCLVLWTEKNFVERKSETEKQRYDEDAIKSAYKSLIGSANILQAGQIVNKSRANFYEHPVFNLPLLKYKFEHHGLIQTLGELPGTPQSIRLKKKHPFWDKIIAQTKLRDGMDGFNYIFNTTGITFDDMEKFLFEQDSLENFQKKSGTARNIYFKVLTLSPSTQVLGAIADEISREIDFRLSQLYDLRDVFLSMETAEEKLIAALQ